MIGSKAKEVEEVVTVVVEVVIMSFLSWRLLLL